MAFTPLATKLHPPPACPTLVARPRLITALSDALTHPLTLVSAPPGYGKTTLVASWLRTTDVPWAWLSLEEADDDPVRFLQYLLTSLQSVAPAIDVDLLGTLQGARTLPDRALIDLLINGVAGGDPFLLVLDDLHAVHDASILELLAYLVDHIPPPMHLVILARSDPPLPLPRLRLRNELLEIRADRLRFTQEEAAVFLNQMMGLGLSAGDIQAMEMRTEGWIAGLHLAALSMQGSSDIHGFVSALSGTHHYIMDYLVDEVLRQQPEGLRSFLLQTSILGRMCGELCSHVVESEAPGAVDGQAMLEALDRLNLFIIPLDDDRRWYRYHHLFAEVLNRSLERLSAGRLPELHQRASSWYEEHGFTQDAIHHALLADDRERAARLMEQNGCGFLMRGEVITLLKWIEAVEPYPQTHAWLGVLKAWALTMTGQLDRAEQALQTAERLLTLPVSTVEGRTVLGSIFAARASGANMQGDTRRAAEFAQQALDGLPDANLFACSMQGVATSILGDARSSVGDLDGAGRAYTDAVRIGRAAENTPMAIIANSNLAGVLLDQGRLQAAARAYRESLALATRPDGQQWPLAVDAHAGLAIISHEWNQLEAAEHHVHQILGLCRQWGPRDIRAVAETLLARLHQIRGNAEDAQQAARYAEELAAGGRFSVEWSSWLKAGLAKFWIAQGKLEKASSFLTDCMATADGDIHAIRLPEYLAFVKLLVARGETDAGLELSARLLVGGGSGGPDGAGHREPRPAGRRSPRSKGGRQNPSTPCIEHSPLPRVRATSGSSSMKEPPMAKLLHQVAAHASGSEYAAELLSAMRKASGKPAPAAQPLIEPLTGRELEVLKLIEAGYSNQEIASRLVISVATLKRHITNLYAKLGVGSRTQALSAGRELKIIT